VSTDQHPHDHDQEPGTEQAVPGTETDEAAAGNEAGTAETAVNEEVAALNEKLLLAHADMQNLRRRAERDVENAHKFALEKFVAELLPVVDNLERALASAKGDSEANKGVIEGVELTLKSLLDVLRRFNVEVVDPAGEPFNPERHEAMAMVPNPDAAPNTIIEVFQKGYLLNDRLVRPAMVVVASGNGNN